MKTRVPYLSAPKESPATSISILLPVGHWPLKESYQEMLKELAQTEAVLEIILLSKKLPEQLLPQLVKESKLRYFQLDSGSLNLMTEAGAFEAVADVLVILKQEVRLPAQALQRIREAVAQGYHFGGLIGKRNRWWVGFLKIATAYCKGLLWFRLCQGFFVDRKLYHQSGGFKQDGRLISFFELLCRQQRLSRYTFLFFRR